MIKHILIAGGAIALTTAPAYASQPASSSGSGGLLQCLGCAGLLKSGGGGGLISAGNLNAMAKAKVNANVSAGNLLNVSTKVGAHSSTGLTAAVKATANLPSLNLGGADCQ